MQKYSMKAEGTSKNPQPRLRHELKFMISYGVYEILRSRFRSVMALDPNAKNGEYRVTSHYFDDVYRTAYLTKLNGEEHRRKFRIRTYNLNSNKIKLECKTKQNDYISKETHSISLEQYQRLLQGDYSWINSEYDDTVIETFARANSLFSLRPSVIVDYQREPFIYPHGNIRFTFDKGVSADIIGKSMFENTTYTRALGNNIILEVKYDDYLPAHIGALLAGVPLVKESISKFVYCIDKKLEVKHHVF